MTPEQEARHTRAVDLLAEHGSMRAAARAAGIALSTFQNWLSPGSWRRGAPAVVAVEPPAAAETPAKPTKLRILSESELEYHADWTAEDCLARLREMAEAEPEKVITRNYFRNRSGISESTWNRYFGTFEEFKRQARIILSRHAHRLEKSIAKHASVDVLRQMNADKREWEGSFLRPSGRRFQTALIVSDIHDEECDPFFRRTLLETAGRVQPEKIILNGDVFDLPEFSKHNQDPRRFRVVERIKWVHAFLNDLRICCPDAEITLIEGNHEFRLLRHMSENDQPLMVVLADLYGFTISKLLGLDKFQVNYVARADMTAWTEVDIKKQLRKNYSVVWDSMIFGHFPEMRSMGYPGANGHHHRHIVWSEFSPAFGPYEWHQMGAGHIREAVYTAGERWGNGMLLAHCDTERRRTQFEYFDTSHEHALIGGRFYQRSDAEIVSDLGGRP